MRRGLTLAVWRRLCVCICRLSTSESIRMMDVLYFALTGGLFALTWGLVRLCDRV